MKWLLTVLMTLVLITGLLFLVLFLSLDMTLQMVRLYFRFIEGEGKYGKRQQLVLQDLDKDTRRLQALSAKLLATNQRQLFQKWLNMKANEDEKLLSQACFNSLDHYLKMHGDHSMPWAVTYLAGLPVVGSFFTWAYKKQHEFWLKAKAKRNQKLISASASQSIQRSSRSSKSSTPESLHRATSFLTTKSASMMKKFGGPVKKVGGSADASPTEHEVR